MIISPYIFGGAMCDDYKKYVVMHDERKTFFDTPEEAQKVIHSEWDYDGYSVYEVIKVSPPDPKEYAVVVDSSGEFWDDTLLTKGEAGVKLTRAIVAGYDDAYIVRMVKDDQPFLGQQ